jgi:hypothetical protein
MTASAPPPCPRAAGFAGWYGTAAILAAYALSSFGVLQSADRVYQALNLTGALGVAWVCWHKRTWQAFWLEAVWAAIALAALVRPLLP